MMARIAFATAISLAAPSTALAITATDQREGERR
jgi:hypothetical protein